MIINEEWVEDARLTGMIKIIIFRLRPRKHKKLVFYFF